MAMRGTEEEQELFAGRVRRFRKAYGLSQRELGELLGITGRTVRNLELCVYPPYEERLLKFAEVEERYRRAREAELEGLEGLS